MHDGEAADGRRRDRAALLAAVAGDALPQGAVAQAVALADKLETLAGLFGIGQVPTGDKDPFGLRRAALGVLRILVERGHALSLAALVAAGVRRVRRRRRGFNADRARRSRLSSRAPARLPARPGLFGANQVEAVLDARPDAHRRPARAAGRRAGVRRAARGRRARRREQAHREHPAQERRRSRGRGRSRAPRRRRRARPLHRPSRSSRRRWTPTSAAATTPARCGRSRAPSRRSTASSTK